MAQNGEKNGGGIVSTQSGGNTREGKIHANTTKGA